VHKRALRLRLSQSRVAARRRRLTASSAKVPRPTLGFCVIEIAATTLLPQLAEKLSG